MSKIMREDQRRIVEALDALPDEERLELLGLYCDGCGRKQPWHPGETISLGGSTFVNTTRGCQCQNDE